MNTLCLEIGIRYYVFDILAPFSTGQGSVSQLSTPFFRSAPTPVAPHCSQSHAHLPTPKKHKSLITTTRPSRKKGECIPLATWSCQDGYVRVCCAGRRGRVLRAVEVKAVTDTSCVPCFETRIPPGGQSLFQSTMTTAVAPAMMQASRVLPKRRVGILVYIVV